MARETISSDVRESFLEQSTYSDIAMSVLSWSKRGEQQWSLDFRNAEKFGVHLVIVSRAGWLPGSFQGYSMHRGLVRMANAGVSSWEALAAVTTRPADFVGRKMGFRVGDIADFFAIPNSPLSDLGNTQEIDFVVKNGRIIDRDKLSLDYGRKRWNRRIGNMWDEAWRW
jgi:hypothetical protein